MRKGSPSSRYGAASLEALVKYDKASSSSTGPPSTKLDL